MKKLIFLVIIIAIGFSSCDDILTEEPKMIASETFYSNAKEVEAGLVGIYAQLNRGLRKNWLCIPESQVDYGYARGSFLPVAQFQGHNITNINRMSDIWIRVYRAIRDANLIIERAPDADATASEIKEFVAEAKFLRAFCYYQLVCYWGAVPLRTEKNITELGVRREPVENIYDFIIDDLSYAEANCPNTPRNMGRPSTTIVKTMLVEVYLSMENWSKAREKALEVINSGKYSLVSVSVPDNFYKIFGYDVNGSSEEIFYIKYNLDLGSEFAVMAHHPSSTLFNKSGNYGQYTDSVKNKVIREWDYKDLRKKFNLYNLNILGSRTTMLYKKYIYPAATGPEAPNDYPVYRYADVLMFYAEADCRINNGPTDDGVEKLNMVRRRAYGLNPNTPSPIDYRKADYNKDTFIDLIVKERGYENMFENKRFKDLVRTGKYAQVIKDVHGIDINPKILLYAIPLDEVQYNDSINETNQNPGY